MINLNYAKNLVQKLNSLTEPINAVIYARVSTDNDGQKESCANQVELAKNYIADHPNINVAGIYVDDGISAKNDYSRPQYKEMLKKIAEGDVDLVITKAQERINRNTTIASLLKELLISTDTTILNLENYQVIDFDDPTAEFMYDIQSIVDAQYVRKQSIKGRKTQELRISKKILSAKDFQVCGYDWHKDTKTATINEEEAELIRRIFDEYVYRNGTPASIQRMLKKEGINKNERTIQNILKDERYIGKFYINKRTSKLGTGQTKSKRIGLPKEDWVLVERPDLQIVDEEVFEMAERIRQSRCNIYNKPDKKTVQAHFTGYHTFAGKIFCPVCGKPYNFSYADRKKTVPIYRQKAHGDCSNPIYKITEADLEEITKKALKHIFDQQNQVYKTLEMVLTECVEATQNNGDEIKRLKQQKKTRENQIDTLIDELSEGGLVDAAKERIKAKINTITEEIDNLTKIIEDKETNKLSINYVSDKVQEIKSAIADLKNFNEIDRDQVLNYIERIELPPNGDVNMLLKSGQVITIEAINNKDFSMGDDVVKMRNQDDRYSWRLTSQSPPHPAPLL